VTLGAVVVGTGFGCITHVRALRAAGFDIVALATGQGYWSEIAYWMIAAGAVTGLVAAPFGFIDWLAIPSGTRAKRIGAGHGLRNVLVILLFAAVNYRGVGESIRINIAITLIELSGLLFIILVGAKVLFSGDGDPGQAFEFKAAGFGVVPGITAGAATAFYAFIGFEDSVNMAEEVRDPIRTFPPAPNFTVTRFGIV